MHVLLKDISKKIGVEESCSESGWVRIVGMEKDAERRFLFSKEEQVQALDRRSALCDSISVNLEG